MAARDLLPLVAIVLSIASLLLSAWTFRFNRHVKGAELRANLLVKIADAKNQAVNLHQYLSTLAEDFRDSDDELRSIGDYSKRARTIAQRLEAIYDKVSSTYPEHGVKMYTSIFHDVHDVNTQIVDLKNSAEIQAKRHREKRSFLGKPDA